MEIDRYITSQLNESGWREAFLDVAVLLRFALLCVFEGCLTWKGSR